MNNLIWEPEIFAIGGTEFYESELEAWITANDMNTTSMLTYGATPLANLWHEVAEDDALERMIEFGGRHCYRAWQSGRDRDSYIKNIIEMEHGSVLEHSSINWAVQGVSRSFSLELARHRVGIALSQESQRFVDASKIKFVVPPMVSYLAGGGKNKSSVPEEFLAHCQHAVDNYVAMQEMLLHGMRTHSDQRTKSLTLLKKRANEAARAHLPNACETRFLWSTNMRLLRHFLWLRGGSGADLEIRRFAVKLLNIASSKAPSVFHDMTISSNDGAFGVPVIVAK